MEGALEAAIDSKIAIIRAGALCELELCEIFNFLVFQLLALVRERGQMSSVKQASQIYARSAVETADRRELEANLLLRAAAQLQAVKDHWCEKPPGLPEALLYNRRLWLLFIDAASSDQNKLPASVRQNILNIGGFVLAEIFSLMTKPDPRHLENLIRINRKLAAGLSAQSGRKAPEAA